MEVEKNTRSVMENNADLKSLIKEVLDEGYLMSLATMDAGGVWVADLIYIHDDELYIYWMSSPEVRHSKAVHQNNKVAGTITISGKGQDNKGIQFEGIVEKIDGPRHDLTVKHYSKRHKPIPEEDEDVLEGDNWYMLKPTKIELIYEKLYGFKKQKLDL